MWLMFGLFDDVMFEIILNPTLNNIAAIWQLLNLKSSFIGQFFICGIFIGSGLDTLIDEVSVINC